MRWPPAPGRAQESVARLQQRQDTAWLAWLPEVRLHVGEAAAKEPAGTLDRELLDDVDELATAVVAPAGIAFGVLVGQHRALRLEHRPGDDVLRGDELDLVALAAELQFYGARDLGVGAGERGGEERIGATWTLRRLRDMAGLEGIDGKKRCGGA